MSASLLSRLQSWYSAQCNGDWEHGAGIQLTTLDNPGWSIRVDLEDTDVEARAFTKIVVQRGGSDWYECEVQDLRFLGFGGPHNLEDLLREFLAWVDAS
jgi:hypothetical protein